MAEYERRWRLANTVEMQREPRLGIALAQVELGRHEEAIRIFDEAPNEIKNDFALNVALAIVFERAGKRDKSAETLKALEEKARQKKRSLGAVGVCLFLLRKKGRSFDGTAKRT